MEEKNNFKSLGSHIYRDDNMSELNHCSRK